MPIEAVNLSFNYNKGTPFEQEVLHDIDFQVKDGEFVGLIGPTRSGKTTLAQHLNALLIPQSGRVIVDGFDTADKHTDLVYLRHRVGYVFQNPDYQLFAPTVGEDIAFGPFNQKLIRSEVENRVRVAMGQVDLDYDTFHDRDIYALSGGQKRRAAIAGVLACEPKALILDDITAGLDPRGRDDILRVIKTLHREQDITIIFISSNMDEASVLAERIVVMNEGRIIMDDKPRQIIEQADELRHIGLELPEVNMIMEKLRRFGYELASDILSVEEAISVIAAILRKKEGSN
ncbi:MAG: energy-coupling factor transporter ATPase [Firmicutes bacterium ML8_F2]|jgi:energy-coupling factor transport system ATP-binding protein|nr:MAG: energy-coupling factor transporter ATPase [Firmicutes bacterium ML8_F2]